MLQKFITKHEKRAQDDEKRKESIKRKLKERLNRKELVKHALSGLNASSNGKKITFDEEDCGFPGGQNRESEFKKTPLFDEHDDTDCKQFELNIKQQFQGKKGYKLLNLQSSYNNDERFKLDERFHDDDDDGNNNVDEYENTECNSNKYVENIFDKSELGDENMHSMKNSELIREKENEIKILESILGSSLQPKGKTNAKKRSSMEMVRYDASNEDHKRISDMKYSKKVDAVGGKKLKLNRKEESKKRSEEDRRGIHNSADKFYQVTEDLRAALKDRKKTDNQFSLLAAFARADVVNEEEELNDYSIEEGKECQERNSYEDQNKLEAKDEEYKSIVNTERSGEIFKVEGIVNEKFFITNGDIRLEEGAQFLNMKDSDEAKQAFENYDSLRTEIREILRLRLQKHRQKKNPFKKKIGGSGRQNSVRDAIRLHKNKK